VKAGKKTISVPESVLRASFSGKVLLKKWHRRVRGRYFQWIDVDDG
jgi:hypothetical protein